MNLGGPGNRMQFECWHSRVLADALGGVNGRSNKCDRRFKSIVVQVAAAAPNQTYATNYVFWTRLVLFQVPLLNGRGVM